jgi:hypothetical protein
MTSDSRLCPTPEDRAIAASIVATAPPISPALAESLRPLLAGQFTAGVTSDKQAS